MFESTNEPYDKAKAHAEAIRNNLIAEWNAVIIQHVEHKLLANKFKDWQKAHIMEIMEKREAKLKECIDLVTKMLELIEAERK